MEHVIERREDDLIDLGAVSAETKGPPGPGGDTQGRALGGGISDE